MKGNSAGWEHHEALQGIAALLLALATLAERAACRARPVRCLVLWLLRQAEKAARAFAVEAGCAAAPLVLVQCPSQKQFQEKCVAVFRPELRKNRELERFRVSQKIGNALKPGDDPDDAVRLARRLRALAAAFFALARLALRLVWVARQSDADPGDAWLDRLLVAPQQRSADTS